MARFENYFLFIGSKDKNKTELYVTQSSAEPQEFAIHSEPLYFDLIVSHAETRLYTVGTDWDPTTKQKSYVLKVWDFAQLVANACKCLFSLQLSN